MNSSGSLVQSKTGSADYSKGRVMCVKAVTQALVEALANPRQDCQGYEVTKTGCDGCGHIVWIDPSLLGAHNYPNHDDT